MSRRTAQVRSNVEIPSNMTEDLDITADDQSLPTWERVLLLALTYEPPEQVAENTRRVKTSCKKV
jgi:hypothetical protein